MSNTYYTAPATPTAFSRAKAAAMRAQFEAIEAAFDLLPSLRSVFDGSGNYVVAGGTANALTATGNDSIDSYADGLTVKVKLTSTNIGAATLNLNALGAIAIQSNAGVALTGGELVLGSVVELTYVSGVFRMAATGPAGPTGADGPSGGRTVLSGAGNPVGGQGVDGDFYIQTTAWTIFGPKAAGAWPAGVTIIGANGTNGVNGLTILNGAGAPSNGLGSNGDFYINTTIYSIYGPKAAGTWPAGVTLVGPTGADGAAGGAADTSDVAFTGTNTVNGDEIGFRSFPKSRTTSSTLTLAQTDNGKYIYYTGAGAATVANVPPNSTVAIAVDSIITIVNDGTGTLVLTRGTSVSMKLAGTGADANRTIAVGGVATLIKVATNTWFVSGPGVT